MHESLKKAVAEFDNLYPRLASSKVIGCVIKGKPVIIVKSQFVGSKSVYVYGEQSKTFTILDMTPDIVDSIRSNKPTERTIILFKNGKPYDLKQIIKDYL